MQAKALNSNSSPTKNKKFLKKVALTKIANYEYTKNFQDCYGHLPAPRHTYYYESVKG
jgi:hypothetical protein